MTAKGPKIGGRRPAQSKSQSRGSDATVPTVAVAMPTPQADTSVPEEAPPVPFVVTPAPASVEVEQQIEAVVAQMVDPKDAVVAASDDAPAAAIQDETQAVADTAPQIEDTTMIHTNDATATVENTTANAQNLFADMNTKAKMAMEKSAKGFEEMNDMAKGNVEAMVEAGRIAAKGFESLGHEVADYSRKSFESATATMKTLATVKSPTEFFKLQSDFVRQSFDSFVAEASKNTETMMKLAGDAAQPISNRVALAAEKIKISA